MIDSLSLASQSAFCSFILGRRKTGWVVRLYDRCLTITLNDIVQYNFELLHRLYGLGAYGYMCVLKKELK